MSTEERPESLAAQAAAWVPPWERRRDPDPEYPSSVDDPTPPEAPDTPEPEATAPAEKAGDPDEDSQPDHGSSPTRDSTPTRGSTLSWGSTLTWDPDPDEDPEPDEIPEPTASSLTDISEMSGKKGAGEAELEAEVAAAEPEPEPEPVAVEPEPEPVAAEPEPKAEPEAGAVVEAPVVEVVAAAVPVQPRRPRESAAAAVQSVVRTEEAVLIDDADLAAALESIMLVVDEPVGELQLAQVLEQPVERIARTLEDISARYTAAGHGIDLRRVAGGWRLYTRPEYAAYVERFVLDGQSVRLTQAALETLAVVAYKQPVTRSRISAIRGVNCDGVMRTLVTRGLIEECGTEPETGAYLYRTTPLFLEKLGLNSVDQLPPLAPFLPDDVEEVLDASG